MISTPPLDPHEFFVGDHCSVDGTSDVTIVDLDPPRGFRYARVRSPNNYVREVLYRRLQPLQHQERFLVCYKRFGKSELMVQSFPLEEEQRARNVADCLGETGSTEWVKLSKVSEIIFQEETWLPPSKTTSNPNEKPPA